MPKISKNGVKSGKDLQTLLSYQLPLYDLAIISLLGKIKEGLDKTHPVLGDIPTLPVMHGGITRQVSEPVLVDSEMKLHSAEITVNKDMYRKTDIREFVEAIYGIWERLAEQSERELFKVLAETTEAVGNIVNGSDKNIWDAQLEMLEKVEMRFDEDGNHGFKFFADPNTGSKLRNGSQPTDEQRRRWDEIMESKREQYSAKKRSRRLS
jgi:hypothetical protein